MQDRVGRDSFPYKVNAISLHQFSRELKKLCVKSGGRQIEVTTHQRVFSYTEEEERKEMKAR